MAEQLSFLLLPARPRPVVTPPPAPVGDQALAGIDWVAVARQLLAAGRGEVPGAPYTIEPGRPAWLRSGSGRAWAFAGGLGAPASWRPTPYGCCILARWLGNRAGVELSLFDAFDAAMRAAGLRGRDAD